MIVVALCYTYSSRVLRFIIYEKEGAVKKVPHLNAAAAAAEALFSAPFLELYILLLTLATRTAFRGE